MQHICSIGCKDYEPNQEPLRQCYFEYLTDIPTFDRKIFEPLFMLSHIHSKGKHGLGILVSIAQPHVSIFSRIKSVVQLGYSLLS